MGWNFGDILDAMGPAVPQDAPAFIHGERVINWGEANRQTNNLARAMIARGSQPGDKIAIYMRNRPEYLMSTAARQRGCMGAVLDGGVRDVDFINAMEYPVFARFQCAASSVGRWDIREYQVPVRIGSTVIRPGDSIIELSAGGASEKIAA